MCLIGIPTIISVISPIIQNNQSPSDVDVWLTFTTMDDGSIDNLTISIDNHDGGSTGDLNSGVTVTTQPLITSGNTVNLSPSTNIYVAPGQLEHTVICKNCMAEHVLPYDMPIDKNTQVNIAVHVGAFYNFGMTGTNYGVIPVSYTIPRR